MPGTAPSWTATSSKEPATSSSVRDPETGDYLVDCIMDAAGAKGTGKWMSQLALDLGVPSTLVTRPFRPFPRCATRWVRASKLLAGPSENTRATTRSSSSRSASALASMIVSYAQVCRADEGRSGRAQVAAGFRLDRGSLWRRRLHYLARSSWNASRKPMPPIPSWKTCCWLSTSRKRLPRPRWLGGTSSPPPSISAFPRLRFPPRWPITMAIALPSQGGQFVAGPAR